MRIYADLGLPAIVRTNELPWVPSPVPGVDRRMLERNGDEVARATSLVRYAPRSRFSEHVHGGGEEVLVLEGIFADEHGEFPAGTYLRNPVGSAHSPRSAVGCVLFVKLHWMHADDRQTVRARLDQQVADEGWTLLEDDRSSEIRRALERDPPLDGDRDRIAGVFLRRLHAFRDESTSLCRMEPGAAVEGWPNPGGLELLVIDGSCSVERQRLGRHGWARMPPGCAPTIASSEGCSLLLKQGHLRLPPPLPT